MPLGCDDAKLGVYVHVPFCDRVCPYCDFAVVAARGGPDAEQEARYVRALLTELEKRASAFEGRGLASLYFGGGTPALLHPDSIARVVEAVEAAFAPSSAPAPAPAPAPPPPALNPAPAPAPIRAPLEVTLEVNPSTVERDRLTGFRAAGVNRLSIGVQSFDDGVLKRLGRAHRAEEAHRTLEAVRAVGFDDISIDLMFAVPGQTPELLARDLEGVARHRPEHVSTYELVIEEGTPFATAAARGQLEAFDPDVAADLLEQLEAELGAQGLRRYELTNFARPGCESAHNRRYWARQPVLGLGVGAWSFDPPTHAAPYGARPANPRALGAWLDAIESARPAADRVDVPSRREAMSEAVFLALRTADGFDRSGFEREFGSTLEAEFGEALTELIERGWIERDLDATQAAIKEGAGEGHAATGAIRLTAAGRMWADAVGSRFV